MSAHFRSSDNRLLSLDVFRGITIFLMILVNSPGNDRAYACFYHSLWNGCTLADLVFPFFVFIVGVSLVFSLSRQLQDGKSNTSILMKIFRRSIVIFLIGLFLNAFPRHFDWESIRVFGVLQRIAICYFFAATLFITTRIRTQALIAMALLVGYWIVLTRVPVPGYVLGQLTLEGNLTGYLDRLIFSSAHLYQKVFDPEGVLSTLPAIATTLIGNITGALLISPRFSQPIKFQTLVFYGVLGLAFGWFWNQWFPINKALWSSSFVLWTGGWALLLLAACYGLIEIMRWKAWSKPFEIFGVNAIAAYFLHIFFLKIQAMIHLPRMNGSPGNLRIFITEHAFGWASIKTGSLLYALCYALLWLLLLGYLYRKNIVIKL